MAKTVILSITGYCNYRCRHCSVSAPKGAMGEMTLEQVKDVLLQIKECGLKEIVLIGGEPMVHPHFREIIEFIQEQGLVLQEIFTNCSLITEEFLDWLLAKNLYPFFRTSFDLCGFHDKMRGVPGAEDKCYRAFELFKRKGFPVSCEIGVSKESLPALLPTLEKLAQCGVCFATVYPPLDCGNWKNVNKSEKLTVHELVDYYVSFIPKFMALRLPISLCLYGLWSYAWPSGAQSFLGHTATTLDRMAEKKACSNYDSELSISADGYLSPCYVLSNNDFVKAKMPNVFKQPLKEILQESAYTKVNNLTLADIVEANPECTVCEYRNLCGGGCRAEALLATGDITKPGPMFCEMFKSGGFNRIVKAVRKGTFLQRILDLKK